MALVCRGLSYQMAICCVVTASSSCQSLRSLYIASPVPNVTATPVP